MRMKGVTRAAPWEREREYAYTSHTDRHTHTHLHTHARLRRTHLRIHFPEEVARAVELVGLFCEGGIVSDPVLPLVLGVLRKSGEERGEDTSVGAVGFIPPQAHPTSTCNYDAHEQRIQCTHTPNTPIHLRTWNSFGVPSGHRETRSRPSRPPSRPRFVAAVYSLSVLARCICSRDVLSPSPSPFRSRSCPPSRPPLSLCFEPAVVALVVELVVELLLLLLLRNWGRKARKERRAATIMIQSPISRSL